VVLIIALSFVNERSKIMNTTIFASTIYIRCPSLFIDLEESQAQMYKQCMEYISIMGLIRVACFNCLQKLQIYIKFTEFFYMIIIWFKWTCVLHMLNLRLKYIFHPFFIKICFNFNLLYDKIFVLLEILFYHFTFFSIGSSDYVYFYFRT